MNVKFVVSGVVALGVILGGYAYRDTLTRSVTGLFKGKDEKAASATQSGGSNGARGAQGSAR